MEHDDKFIKKEEVQAARTNKSSFIIIVILIVMVVALVIALLWALQQSRTPSGPTDPSPTASGPCYDGLANTTPADYTVYENTDLGYKFAYPSGWGEVSIEVDHQGGSAGKYLIGTFSENSDVWFGGNATDYTVLGRDGMPTDNPGYLVASGKYYSVEVMKYDDGSGNIEPRDDLHALEEGAQLKNGCNAKALVSKYPKTELPDYSYDVARFNLQPENDYYGVNFVLKNPTAATRGQLNNLISTFQLLD